MEVKPKLGWFEKFLAVVLYTGIGGLLILPTVGQTGPWALFILMCGVSVPFSAWLIVENGWFE